MDSIAADIAARTAEGHAAFSMRGTDDRWILIQTNTFTNWVNEQLKPLDVEVTQELHTEFTDGIKLCQLMEVLQVNKLLLTLTSVRWPVVCVTLSAIFMPFYYRPHPKDGGRYYFHFVCQSTPWRGQGYPIPRSGWGGVPHSQVLMGGGVPYPRSWWGYPYTQDWLGYPSSRTG